MPLKITAFVCLQNSTTALNGCHLITHMYSTFRTIKSNNPLTLAVPYTNAFRSNNAHKADIDVVRNQTICLFLVSFRCIIQLLRHVRRTFL
ncbi:hypothetical protein BDZ45DRAFT_108161 [Acephala macrosclerotiorum]|nr:hypothetical protein BDZ45DRAFT_108161 [Acephala macrosclerotiorum]